MTIAEQVAALERENAELKAKVAALEAQIKGTPVYVPYPVYPPVQVPSVWPVWPNTDPYWPQITWTVYSADNTAKVTP